MNNLNSSRKSFAQRFYEATRKPKKVHSTEEVRKLTRILKEGAEPQKISKSVVSATTAGIDQILADDAVTSSNLPKGWLRYLEDKTDHLKTGSVPAEILVGPDTFLVLVRDDYGVFSGILVESAETVCRLEKLTLPAVLRTLFTKGILKLGESA